jgi:hypothetical protein
MSTARIDELNEDIPPYKRPGFDFGKANEELAAATNRMKALGDLILELEAKDLQSQHEDQ